MPLPTLESLTPALDAACMQGLGDTVTYTPAGGTPLTLKAYVDHREAERSIETGKVIEQAVTAQIRIADVPVRPGRDSRLSAAKLGAAAYRPVNVRRDASGTHWEFELEQVGA